MTALEAALGLARVGWPVFPCASDKTPLTPHSFRDATADAETIRSWWTLWPTALIGIPMGRRTGVWAIDCDVPRVPGALTGSSPGNVS